MPDVDKTDGAEALRKTGSGGAEAPVVARSKETARQRAPPKRLSRTASRLTSHYHAMQDRARNTALESMRHRRLSARGTGAALVHPEGILLPVGPSTDDMYLGCESYKYDGEESRIHFERRMELDVKYRRLLDLVTLILVVVIGVLVAMIATGQIVLAGLLHGFVQDHMMRVMWPAADPHGGFTSAISAESVNASLANTTSLRARSTAPTRAAAVSASTAAEGSPRLFAGFCVYWALNTCLILLAALLTIWAPQAKGSGLPALKAYLNGIHQRKRWATGTALIAKSIGITLVVSTALPLGKEGPMVHIGAMAGAVVSRTTWFGLDRFFELRLPKNQREWVGMGAAAGVAAAFNAPLGGILYSFEEVCSSWSANVRVWLLSPAGPAAPARGARPQPVSTCRPK